MARQTELLQRLVEGQQAMQQQQQHHRHRGHHQQQPQVATYLDFFGTQPPLFTKAEEPLNADAWLKTIESKFALLVAPCSDPNKALFAAQQLRGPAHL